MTLPSHPIAAFGAGGKPVVVHLSDSMAAMDHVVLLPLRRANQACVGEGLITWARATVRATTRGSAWRPPNRRPTTRRVGERCQCVVVRARNDTYHYEDGQGHRPADDALPPPRKIGRRDDDGGRVQFLHGSWFVQTLSVLKHGSCLLDGSVQSRSGRGVSRTASSAMCTALHWVVWPIRQSS